MRRTPRSEGSRRLAYAEEDHRWADHPARVGGYYLACLPARQVAENFEPAFDAGTST